ncbi:hypothetical protein RJ55_05976 [Drechmeria coniospora]|nr:hypothetical protein RJ55_05976 [Drechmeria coniospora]
MAASSRPPSAPVSPSTCRHPRKLHSLRSPGMTCSGPPPSVKSPTDKHQGRLRTASPNHGHGKRPSKPPGSPSTSRPPPKKPSPPGRAEWAEWRQLTLRLDNLPLDVTMGHLWSWFSSEGTIVWMDMQDAAKGTRGTMSARIRFEPPPRRAFWAAGTIVVWHPDVRNYPGGLFLRASVSQEGSRGWFVSGSAPHQRRYPVNMTAPLRQLDFGTLVAPAAMMVIKSLRPCSAPGVDMELELDVGHRRLTVRFPVDTKSKDGEGVRQFCFRVDLSSVKRMHQSTEGGNAVWILPLSRPPHYYWKVEDVASTFGDDDRAWSSGDLWFRATDIVRDADAPMKHPVAVHSDIDDPGRIDIGRWTAFRLVLEAHPTRGRVESPDLLLSALEDFNVSVRRCADFELRPPGPSVWHYLNHPPIPRGHPASALLELSAAPVIHLAFEVRYQLEVCVSRGILNEYTMTPGFLRKLAALETLDATRRLEFLVDQNEAVHDPMELFTHADAEAYMPSLRIPHYCAVVRKVVVTPTAVRCNSPTVETSNRVMRKYNHIQDRFLRVQFIEEAEQGRIAINRKQSDDIWKRILRTLYQGIRIGDRVYEFLGFGSSQLRQCGVYFYCPTEHTSCDDIRRWMGEFTHIRVVAKYAARLGQCFSTTREIRGIFEPSVKPIADVERDGHCFTDGVGKISPFLASLIIEEMTLDVFDEPTAFQFRMGGCKGVLTVSPDAQGMEVHVRRSQEKFKAATNCLEVIRCAKCSTATLNRQTITILECLGVPVGAFQRLLDRQIREYQQAMRSNAVAVGLLTKFVDENQSTLILAELLKAGFRTDDLQEPFALNLLNLWRSWSLKLLKEKARIQVEESAFVIGCVDETGTLRGHSAATEGSPAKDVDRLPQIFLQLTDPARRHDGTVTVEGTCIVGRNPSLHPGDIRVVQAVDCPELRHLKDVVVFPSKGDRPVPNMLSGGDLDGDDFFVIWDPTLMPREWNFPPMSYAPAKPLTLSRDVEVNDIRDFFVKYLKNDVLPLIATSHLALCDEFPDGPKSQTCLHLAELHSKAVDYPKTGDPADWNTKLQPKRWPHFMEKKNSYRSKRALGVIYDKVVKQTIQFLPDWEHAFDQRITGRFELDDGMLEEARRIKRQYDMAVRRILTQHDVETEFELYTGWAMSRPAIGSDYKRQEDLGREYDALKSRFRDMCYEAAGGSGVKTMERFVAAMYTVTEQEIKIALLEHHGGASDDGGEHEHGKGGGGREGNGRGPRHELKAKSMPLISFPWIFHRIMIRIATGDGQKPTKSLLAAAQRKTRGAASMPSPGPASGEVPGRAAAPPPARDGCADAYAGCAFLDVDDLLGFPVVDDGGEKLGATHVDDGEDLLELEEQGCDDEGLMTQSREDISFDDDSELDKVEEVEVEAEEGESGPAMDRLAALLGFDDDD